MCWYQLKKYKCGCEAEPDCYWECRDVTAASPADRAMQRCAPEAPIPVTPCNYCCSEYCCRITVREQVGNNKPNITYVQAKHILDAPVNRFGGESIEGLAKLAHQKCTEEQDNDPLGDKMRRRKIDAHDDAMVKSFVGWAPNLAARVTGEWSLHEGTFAAPSSSQASRVHIQVSRGAGRGGNARAGMNYIVAPGPIGSDTSVTGTNARVVAHRGGRGGRIA